MSDAGEALIDADARIQERMEELERERTRARSRDGRDPAQVQAIESLKLARIALERQLAVAVHDRHRMQLTQAIEEVGRRMSAALASVR
jgi:hypothetical protein